MVCNGLYLNYNKKGLIKRTLVIDGKEEIFPSVRVQDEIIEFSEYNFKNYAKVVKAIENLTDECVKDPYADVIELYSEKYNELTDLIKRFEDLLVENDKIMGYLQKWNFEDVDKFGSPYTTYFYENMPAIINSLYDIMRVQIHIKTLLGDMASGNELDFEDKHSVFGYLDVHQIYRRTNERFESFFWIRSPAEYYLFLMQVFLDLDCKVSNCRCCGRYFVPKTKKPTYYCDRIVRNNRTCKQFAPQAKHKLLAENDVVIKTFDSERNKLQKRLERTRIYGTQIDKPLTYEQYYDWSAKAAKARDEYLKGGLTEQEALKIIVAE